MFSRRLKTGYFVLEGLNSFATVYYFYYFYFFMQKEFGFGNKANLALAALNGAVYALMAWQGGNFAQRFGYFTALKLGFAVMLGALAIGSQVHTASGHIVVMAVTVVGMCFTWPTLEALVSEGETRAGVQRMVGIYNMIWAGTAAIAYFTGGAMLEKLGPQKPVLRAGGNSDRPARPDAVAGIPGPPTDRATGFRPGRRPARARTGAASAFGGHDPDVPAPGVAGQSLRLHRHQHAHGGHARRGPAAGALHHGRRVLLLGVVLLAAGGVLRLVALDRLALPFSVAAGVLPHAWSPPLRPSSWRPTWRC